MDAGPDAELVRRSLSGDPEAFGELVGAYQKVLYNVALRMVNDREDAEDLVQTAFLKAYRALHTYDPRHKFFSWIYRILTNEALNLLQRRRPQEEVSERLASEERPPDDCCHEREIGEIVRRGLMELSTDHRQVLILRHLLHQSHRDIGEALGLPEKTVKSRLYTARQLLAVVLRRRGIGPTS